MAGVFIGDRRDDSQGWAARLAHDLAEALGPDPVFSDIEIPKGSDFGVVLHRAIAACDVLLVVIGRRWAAAATPGGRTRLSDPDDWVRIEIEAALSLGKPVIPVPVASALLPADAALPASLRPMLRLQAAPLSERHWRADVAALAEHLRALVPDARAHSADRGAGAGDGAGKPAPAPRGRDTLAEVVREIAEQVRRDGRAGQAPARMPSVGAGLVRGPAARARPSLRSPARHRAAGRHRLRRPATLRRRRVAAPSGPCRTARAGRRRRRLAPAECRVRTP